MPHHHIPTALLDHIASPAYLVEVPVVDQVAIAHQVVEYAVDEVVATY